MKKQNFCHAVILVFAVLSTGLPVRANDLEWPVFRHDQGRTGRSLGTGDITDPATVWSYHVGGRLTQTQILLTDIEQDGTEETAYIESGRLIIKSLDDKIHWAAEMLGLSEIVGTFDFNGDGRKEILTTAWGPPAKLVIIDALTGDVVWSYAGFGEGAASIWAKQTLVSDTTGDGLPDIVCSARIDDMPTHAFSFAEDFSADSGLNHIWAYANKRYGQEIYYVSGDIDKNGTIEVIFLEYDQVTVLNGADGTLYAALPKTFLKFSLGLMRLFEMNNAIYLLTIGSAAYNVQISVFDLQHQKVMWQYQWYPSQNKNIAYSDQSPLDLDRDGNLEIAVSVYDDRDNEYTINKSVPGDHDGVNNPNEWTLLIFDAQTGALEMSKPDTYLHGILTPAPSDTPVLAVQQDVSNTRIVPSLPADLDFFSYQNNALVHSRTLEDVYPLTQLQRVSASTSNMNPKPLFEEIDIDSDGFADSIWLFDADRNGVADRILALGTDDRTAELSIDESISVSPIRGDTVTTSLLGGVAFFASNGTADFISDQFTEKNSILVGGYQAPVIAADTTGDGKSEIITALSIDQMLTIQNTLSPSGAIPETLWTYDGGKAYLLYSTDIDSDGNREFITWDRSSIDYAGASLIDNFGSPLWTIFLGDSTAKLHQCALGNFDNDGIEDFVFLHVNPTLPQDRRWLLTAVSGSNGAVIWQTVAKPADTDQYVVPLQTADVDMDGTDDVIFLGAPGLYYFSGADGNTIATIAYETLATGIVFADMDMDLQNELLFPRLLQANGIQLFDISAQATIWTRPCNYYFELYNKYLSLFSLDDHLNILKTDALGQIELYNGLDGSDILLEPAWLRDGDIVFDTQEENSNILYTSVADINGDGAEDAIISTADGYLIAVSLPDLSVLWRMDMRASVGEPVLADVDGDGKLEIIASTSNGYIHLIDQQGVEAPTTVRDVAINDVLEIIDAKTDVDETRIREAFGVAWDAVKGAVGYRVTVVDENNTAMISWVNTGKSTQIVLDTGPRLIGRPYFAVVQAYDATGHISSEAFSDGLTVVDRALPSVDKITFHPRALNPGHGNIRIDVDLSDDVWLSKVILEIVDKNGLILSSDTLPLSRREAFASFTWDGFDDNGNAAAPGFYKIRAVVLDSVGKSAVKERRFIVVGKCCKCKEDKHPKKHKNCEHHWKAKTRHHWTHRSFVQ